MFWFWFGFFALVALLLVLDLGVLHRSAKEPTVRSAAAWTAGWVAFGLAFSGVVYLIYQHHHHHRGGDAAITYVSAYLLEQALSVDNVFVMALMFATFRVPARYQHRVLFWGILGAIGFRITMLCGGAYLTARFSWLFYIFGAYLAWQGAKLLRESEDEEAEASDRSMAVRVLRRFVRIVDGDHGGKFSVVVDGRRALTTVAVCLVVIELTDIVFALDSIPAVLTLSSDTFIIVTSNVFAIMGLRSLYFVLAAAMPKFRYLKVAIAVLLMLIGAKMIAHVEIAPPITLAVIGGIIAVGILASIVATRRERQQAEATER